MSIMFFYMSELHFLHGCFMFCCISALDFGVKQITFTPLPQTRLHFKVTWIDCVLGYNGYHLSPPDNRLRLGYNFDTTFLLHSRFMFSFTELCERPMKSQTSKITMVEKLEKL